MFLKGGKKIYINIVLASSDVAFSGFEWNFEFGFWVMRERGPSPRERERGGCDVVLWWKWKR